MSIAAWIEIVLNVLRTCVAFDICCVVRRAGVGVFAAFE